MEKLTTDSPEARSTDLVANTIANLRSLLPNVFTEGKLDFAVLRQELGDQVEDQEEKFGLNWHGKRRARQLALTPSLGTLRPCPEESVGWDTAQNILIEGDNLETLKLLQKSYAGKIDLIYIDPPYNTGKDFVYPDNFSEGIKNYLEITSQTSAGIRISSNPETSGRFHTDWLNMIYPRLRLARQLMADHGMIFISINDKEIHNLRNICDELFGEENFIECYIWNSTFRPDNSSKVYRKNAEFVLCYAKRIDCIGELVGEHIERTGLPSLTKASMAKSILEFPENSVIFSLADGHYPKGIKDSYELLDDVQVLNNTNSNSFRLKGNMIWGQDNLLKELQQGTRIIIKTESFVPYVDKGAQGTLRPSKIISNEIVGDVLSANAEIRELLGENVFNYPKPVSLIKYFIKFRKENNLILDFFAGSGTTAHAVMEANAEDGGSRNFILVQLPEFLNPENPDQVEAAAFCRKHGRPTYLSELTKIRVRKAGEKFKKLNTQKQFDDGLKIFKLDSSNIRAWDEDKGDLNKSLLDSVEHIKDGRSENDLLFELLLKFGLSLTVRIEKRIISQKCVYSIGSGTLMACLDSSITMDTYESLAIGIHDWHRELTPAGGTTLVFRDSAFADDVTKTNLTAILSQHGLDNIRSL